MRRAVALNGLLLDEYGPVRSNKTGGLRTFSEQRRDEAQRAYADVQNRKKRTMNNGKYLTESSAAGAFGSRFRFGERRSHAIRQCTVLRYRRIGFRHRATL